jgi:hypothetical protein
MGVKDLTKNGKILFVAGIFHPPLQQLRDCIQVNW